MKPAAILFVATSLAARAAASCQHGTFLEAKESRYDYGGQRGPALWHTLGNGTNTACALGKNQSPIDLYREGPHSTKLVDGRTFDFKVPYVFGGARLENLGTTVEVSVNGSAKFHNESYRLVQFHFHTPSEHHIEGRVHDLEVHFVFQSDDNLRVGVIGFLIDSTNDPCKESEFLQDALQNVNLIPKLHNQTKTESLDASDMEKFFADGKAFSYNGSLTTPPCTEGVSFVVAENPLHVSWDSVQKVRKVLGFNARPVQSRLSITNVLEESCLGIKKWEASSRRNGKL